MAMPKTSLTSLYTAPGPEPTAKVLQFYLPSGVVIDLSASACIALPSFIFLKTTDVYEVSKPAWNSRMTSVNKLTWYTLNDRLLRL